MGSFWKKLWRGLSAVSIIAGASTVLPAPASKPCLLGYYAHCSFTPVATAVCVVLAVVFWWVGGRR